MGRGRRRPRPRRHHRLRPGRARRRRLRAAPRRRCRRCSRDATLRRGRVDEVGVGDLRAGHRHRRRGERRPSTTRPSSSTPTRTATGWIFVVEMADPSEVDALLDAAAYRAAGRGADASRRAEPAWRLVDDLDGRSTPPAQMARRRRAPRTRSRRARRRRCGSYRWSPPALSLGRFQPDDDVDRGACAAARRRGRAAADRRPGAPPRRRPHLRGRACRDPTGADGEVDAIYRLARRRRSSPGLARLGVDAAGRPARRPGRARSASRASRAPTCGSATASCAARRRSSGTARCSSTARSCSTGSPFDETDLLRSAGTPGRRPAIAPARDRHARGAGRAAPTRAWSATRVVEGFRAPSTSTSARARRRSTSTARGRDGHPSASGGVASRRCDAAGAATRTRPAPTSARRAAARSPRRGRDDAEPHRARRAPGARRGARRRPRRAARGHGHARRAPGPERREPVRARRATSPRSAATPTPTSSSTTSPSRAATPRSRAPAGGYEVRDVGSLNGTYVDHERVETAPLQHLDELQIGRFVLRRSSLGGEAGARERPRGRPSTSRSGRCSPSCSDEFPDITISKIRFLESQGLIDPERTPSGYRKFYAADSRACGGSCYQQKEHFLPLKVIKERLDELAAGRARPARSTPDLDAGRPRRRRRAAGDGPSAPQPRRVATPRAAGAGRPGPRPRRRRAPRRDRDRRRSRPTLPADDAGARRPAVARRRRRRAPHPRPSWPRRPGSTTRRSTSSRSFGLLAPPREVGGDGALRRRRARGRPASRPASSAAASRPATCACTARSPSARRCCSARCCMPYVRQRNPEARARLQEELVELGDARAPAADGAPAAARSRETLRRVSGRRRRSPARDAARRGRRSRECVDRLGAEIARRPSRRRRARRRAQGRADLPRRSRPGDPARRRRASTSSRSRGYAPDSGRVRILQDVDTRPRGPRRRARRGPRRHRPHPRLPPRAPAARGPRGVDVCTLLDRPARRIVPARRPLRRARRSPTCSCSATGCTTPTCTGTSRGSWRPTARSLRRRPDAYVAALYGRRAGGRGGGPVLGWLECRSGGARDPDVSGRSPSRGSRRTSRSCSSARTRGSATCRSSSGRRRPPRSSTRSRAWRRPGR